ncbi:hypothetical protein F5148DRAFT_1364778 [Russula earlei]|uniref:Uncharacterized protein n=1 Tax=Russula earlei TaxID=71964 RepID=A0ACC0UPD0_9AGAM|nr:hypothetical protein F5148DRAFT_1364778 [Russula earlei]
MSATNIDQPAVEHNHGAFKDVHLIMSVESANRMAIWGEAERIDRDEDTDRSASKPWHFTFSWCSCIRKADFFRSPSSKSTTRELNAVIEPSQPGPPTCQSSNAKSTQTVKLSSMSRPANSDIPSSVSTPPSPSLSPSQSPAPVPRPPEPTHPRRASANASALVPPPVFKVSSTVLELPRDSVSMALLSISHFRDLSPLLVATRIRIFIDRLVGYDSVYRHVLVYDTINKKIESQRPLHIVRSRHRCLSRLHFPPSPFHLLKVYPFISGKHPLRNSYRNQRHSVVSKYNAMGRKCPAVNGSGFQNLGPSPRGRLSASLGPAQTKAMACYQQTASFTLVSLHTLFISESDILGPCKKDYDEHVASIGKWTKEMPSHLTNCEKAHSKLIMMIMGSKGVRGKKQSLQEKQRHLCTHIEWLRKPHH